MNAKCHYDLRHFVNVVEFNFNGNLIKLFDMKGHVFFFVIKFSFDKGLDQHIVSKISKDLLTPFLQNNYSVKIDLKFRSIATKLKFSIYL
jgi:hypothetical protein